MQNPKIILAQRPGKRIELLYAGYDAVAYNNIIKDNSYNEGIDDILPYAYAQPDQVIHPSANVKAVQAASIKGEAEKAAAAKAEATRLAAAAAKAKAEAEKAQAVAEKTEQTAMEKALGEIERLKAELKKSAAPAPVKPTKTK